MRGKALAIALAISLPRANFIDNYLFDKMAADRMAPAPVSSDAEFLRRLSLDLTGRIPLPEVVQTFLNIVREEAGAVD